MQPQLLQIVIFGETFSRSKLLFLIFPLNRTLLQGNSFPRTRHATLSTCKTRLMIRSARLTTRSTPSTRFPTHSNRFSTRSTRLFTRSTRLFTRSTRLSIRLSTRSTRLSTRSTRSTICRSFYN